mgnify:CR=1 FL=1|jgi:hypothetical protein
MGAGVSSNILHSEYLAEIAIVAPRWLGFVERGEIRWESALGRVSCSVELRTQGANGYCVPVARVGSSGTLPGDVAHALVLTLDTAETLRRCLSAHAQLSGLVVWFDSAPCDSCGSRGTTGHGAPCRRCDGTGKRCEVKP